MIVITAEYRVRYMKDMAQAVFESVMTQLSLHEVEEVLWFSQVETPANNLAFYASSRMLPQCKSSCLRSAL